MEVILSGQEQLSYHLYMGVGTGYRSLWRPLKYEELMYQPQKFPCDLWAPKKPNNFGGNDT